MGGTGIGDCETAIKAFKKMLRIAWISNDAQSEIKAYANLGTQYFYFQELD